MTTMTNSSLPHISNSAWCGVHILKTIQTWLFFAGTTIDTVEGTTSETTASIWYTQPAKLTLSFPNYVPTLWWLINDVKARGCQQLSLPSAPLNTLGSSTMLAARKQVDDADLGCADPSSPNKSSIGSKDLNLQTVWTLCPSLSPITLPDAMTPGV